MIFYEPSAEIEPIELFVPVVVVRKVLNYFLDGLSRVVELRELFFGRIVCGFVVDLMRFLFCDGSGLLDGEWLLSWNGFGLWLAGHWILACVVCIGRHYSILLKSFVDVLFGLYDKVVLFGLFHGLGFLFYRVRFQRSSLLLQLLFLRHKAIALLQRWWVVLLDEFIIVRGGFLRLKGIESVGCFVFHRWDRFLLVEWLEFLLRCVIRKILNCVNHLRFLLFSSAELYLGKALFVDLFDWGWDSLSLPSHVSLILIILLQHLVCLGTDFFLQSFQKHVKVDLI